jgi:Concanavalin A-like lectin/glucanases superfamily
MAFSFLKPGRPTIEDELNDLKLRVRALEAIVPCCSPTTPAFGDLAKSIAGVDILRGYWVLGDPDGSSGEMEETSGWSGGPSPFTIHNHLGTELVQDVPGCLGIDTGACEWPGFFSQSYLAASNSAMFTTGDTSDVIDSQFSVCGWVNPASETPDIFRGGIFANQSVAGSGPYHEEGWDLECYWDGSGNIFAQLVRNVAGTAVIASAAVAPDVCSFVAGTYDGATLSIYINGVLADSQSDSRTPAFTGAVSAPTTGQLLVVGPFTPITQYFDGTIDDVCFWAPAVLTGAEWGQLYAAGIAT